jgi:hypothetical protein
MGKVEEDEDEDPVPSKTVGAVMSQHTCAKIGAHTHKLGQFPGAENSRQWADWLQLADMNEKMNVAV